MRDIHSGLSGNLIKDDIRKKKIRENNNKKRAFNLDYYLVCNYKKSEITSNGRSLHQCLCAVKIRGCHAYQREVCSLSFYVLRLKRR